MSLSERAIRYGRKSSLTTAVVLDMQPDEDIILAKRPSVA